MRADIVRPALGTRAEAALAGGVDGAEALRELVEVALDGLAEGAAARGGPIPAADPGELESRVWAALGGEPLPRQGVGAEAALRPLARLLAYGAADPADPACAAHLHTPPLAVAVAADLVASALNPSMDSWDQAPAATALEAQVMRGLAELVGLRAGGRRGDDLRRDGLEPDGPAAGPRPPAARAPARALLRGRPLLDRSGRPRCSGWARERSPGSRSTPGTGWTRRRCARPCAAAARSPPWWSRPPAPPTPARSTPSPRSPAPAPSRARGSTSTRPTGAGRSSRTACGPLLAGLDRADSIALDLHKLGWQPLAAGAFLVRDAALMAPLERRVAYLNPADDEAAGYASLLGRSLRTSRRADAFKVAVTLRALGVSGLGRLVDRCHALARHAAGAIAAEPLLQLALPPVLTTVVFRYAAAGDRDAVNAALRRGLLRGGRAVIGRTELRGPGGPEVWLKLTLLNPHARTSDVDALLEAVVAAGRAGETA